MNNINQPFVITSNPDKRIHILSASRDANVLMTDEQDKATFIDIQCTVININPAELPCKLLIDAVNNRTRERNYFRLYSQLLSEEISEEEFDSEIDDNPDEYVVPVLTNPTLEELRMAAFLSTKIKDVESVGDFSALFSFKESDVDNHYLNLNNARILQGRRED